MVDPAADNPSRQGKLQRVKSLGEAFGWLAALITSIGTIAAAVPALTEKAGSVVDAVFYPMPTNVAVFLSDDQPFANQYITILAERGFDARFEPLSAMKNVVNSARPGLLFLHKSGFAKTEQIILDEAARHRLARNVKIIGIGGYGADFIHDMDPASMLGGVMEVSEIAAILDDPDKPKDIGRKLPANKKVSLYDHDTVDPAQAVAAYDFGSTAIQQPPAQGIARVTGGEPRDRCTGAHWSVAIQGNLALWGYQLPAASLTDEGRKLFGDLAMHMRQTPYVRFEGQFAETEPGELEGRLGCSLTSQVYRFRPTAPGAITAKASTDHPVAVILNAPYRVGAIAREDGLQPQFTVQVQPDQLQKPGDWTISVEYFGDVQPDTNFKYTLQLEYPYAAKRSVLWLIAAAVALALGLFAAGRLILIVHRRSHQAAKA